VGFPQPHFGKGGQGGILKLKSLPKDTPLSLQRGVFIHVKIMSYPGWDVVIPAGFNN